MRYPLFLNIQTWPVVVVGAGAVASRKIRSLLAAGARVTVISPQATPSIRRMAAAGKLRWRKRRFIRGDLRHARLAVAATDDLDVNRRVCAEAIMRGLPVNCVAPPDAGNFFAPSVLRRGGITLAISTGGASPAFAKRLRRDLEAFLDDGYSDLLKQMSATRKNKMNQLHSSIRSHSKGRRS